MSEIKTVESDFKEVVRILDESFSKDYAVKNPELVQFLMQTVQEEKSRNFNKALNKLP